MFGPVKTIYVYSSIVIHRIVCTVNEGKFSDATFVLFLKLAAVAIIFILHHTNVIIISSRLICGDLLIQILVIHTPLASTVSFCLFVTFPQTKLTDQSRGALLALTSTLLPTPMFIHTNQSTSQSRELSGSVYVCACMSVWTVRLPVKPTTRPQEPSQQQRPSLSPLHRKKKNQ